jgi:hypothetical protein
MNKFQHTLRLIIATGSTVGFLGGWALLAHAGKPVAAGTLATVDDTVTTISVPANLPPLDFKALESTNSSINVQTFAPPPVTFQTFGRTRLRTGGS